MLLLFTLALFPFPLPLSDLSLSLSLPCPGSDSGAGGSATGTGVVSVNWVVACVVRSALSPFPLLWPLSAGAGVDGVLTTGASAGGASGAVDGWAGAGALVSPGCDAGSTTGFGSFRSPELAGWAERVEVRWASEPVVAVAVVAVL